MPASDAFSKSVGMITCLKKAIDKSSTNRDNLHLDEKLVMLSTHRHSHDLGEVAVLEMLSCLKALAMPELAARLLGTVSFRSNSFFNELLSLCNTLGWIKLMPGLKTMFMKSTSNVELCVDLLGKLVGINSNEVLQPDRKNVKSKMYIRLNNRLMSLFCLIVSLHWKEQLCNKLMHFKAKESHFHIHKVIDSLSVGGDLNHTTERVGSPYTLVITKTHNSMEQKKATYKKNLAMLEVLRHIKDTGEPLPKRLKA